MQETINYNDYNVMINLNDEKVITQSLQEFRHYALKIKDLKLVPALLEKKVVVKGSTTFILDYVK